MLAPMLGQYWNKLAPDPERTLDTVIFFLTMIKNLTFFTNKKLNARRSKKSLASQQYIAPQVTLSFFGIKAW